MKMCWLQQFFQYLDETVFRVVVSPLNKKKVATDVYLKKMRLVLLFHNFMQILLMMLVQLLC